MFNQAYAGHLPIEGSDIAGQWDSLYVFLIWLSLFLCIVVVGGMIYFAIRYRQREGRRSKYITGNHLIEGVWIFVPTVLLMGIFVWGYALYHKMVESPSDALEVKVIGKQWKWIFQYEDGRITTGKVYVPYRKPVKFVMSSEDVIHSFFIPNFRVKQDVVPGMYTSVWFNSKVLGKHQVYCTEYCGGDHSQMLAQVVVLNDEQFKNWMDGVEPPEYIHETGMPTNPTGSGFQLANSSLQKDSQKGSPGSVEERGRKLMQTRGCVACHTDDGSTKVGPTLKGLFGHQVTLSSGQTLVADVNYLRESIENPNAKVVKGFAPSMPTFQGTMNELELNALIAYIKSIR